MDIRPSVLLATLGLAFAFLLIDGCSTSRPPIQNSRHLREVYLQHMWRGKPYAELLQAYGPPRLVMSVANHPPEKEAVVVYGIMDESSRCVDAFLVGVQRRGGEMIVADYFCR